jgi:type VI secretion system protein ImpD
MTSRIEKELSELGFLVLCHCKSTGRAIFHGCDSIHEPETFDDAMAEMNAKLSSMLHYLLCASRFAHYVKVMVRDKIGRVTTAEECERFLSGWLLNYATGADDISLEMMAKHPLREFKIEVKELPGKPGSYRCVVHLRPHFQLDQVVSSVRLVTELAQVQAS